MSEEVAEREERDNRTGSLKSVIDVIPGAAYENPTWRGMLNFARDLVIYVGRSSPRSCEPVRILSLE